MLLFHLNHHHPLSYNLLMQLKNFLILGSGFFVGVLFVMLVIAYQQKRNTPIIYAPHLKEASVVKLYDKENKEYIAIHLTSYTHALYAVCGAIWLVYTNKIDVLLRSRRKEYCFAVLFSATIIAFLSIAIISSIFITK